MAGAQDLPLLAVMLLGSCTAAAAAAAAAEQQQQQGLCLNQLQVLATHNSYHLPPAKEVLQLLASPVLAGAGGGSHLPEAWEGSMPPLAEQLDAGACLRRRACMYSAPQPCDTLTRSTSRLPLSRAYPACNINVYVLIFMQGPEAWSWTCSSTRRAVPTGAAVHMWGVRLGEFWLRWCTPRALVGVVLLRLRCLG